MNSMPNMVSTLEELLVQEFRACQTLHTLTKDERAALSSQNVETISKLVEHKEALLDELSQVEDQRRMVMQEITAALGISSKAPTISEVAAELGSEIGDRISRLREGILVLSNEIRELTSGNQALVRSGLERVDAVQSFLLELYSPTLSYRPPGAPARPAQSLAWDIDQGI